MAHGEDSFNNFTQNIKSHKSQQERNQTSTSSENKGCSPISSIYVCLSSWLQPFPSLSDFSISSSKTFAISSSLKEKMKFSHLKG